MDGTSEQPSSDVTAMDGSGNNKGNSRTNGNDTGSSTSSPQPLAGDANSGYLAPAAMAMMRASSGTRNSTFAMPTSIPPSGCGCIAVGPPDREEITISITPTTGGQFALTVEHNETIENLKKIISKKLKVAKERICLLHRERQLREGTLKENHLQHGSRLILLPSVETGLMGQRPEQSVMQALESLNDSQVNDFLSGKAPLNLTMRLGDQMMLIQLQLSTVTPASPPAPSVATSGSASTSNSAAAQSSSSFSSSLSCDSTNTSCNNSPSTTLTTSSLDPSSQRRSSDHLGRSMRIAKQNGNSSPTLTPSLISSLASAVHAASCSTTSLSTATTTTNPCATERTASPSPPSSPPSTSSTSPTSSSSFSSSSSASSSSSSSSSRLIWQRKHLQHYRHHHSHHHHHHHHHYHSRNKQPTICDSVHTTAISTTASSPTSLTDPASTSSQDSPMVCTSPKKKLCSMGHHQADAARSPDCDSVSASSLMSFCSASKTPAATLDTRALAEASRNLTQKLKQLSSEEHARRRQGAIIESMHHHGKGVYSGTFSGTLNPALQDRHGRPKRDISTIIHILNDLLCATPAATAGHYRHHHRHSSGRQQALPSSSTSPTSDSIGTQCGSTSPNGSCQDSSTSAYSMEELSKENEATKGKMRRLRLVMEQRQAKRKARRQARAEPYTTQWAARRSNSCANDDPSTSSTSSSSPSGPNASEPQNEPRPCSPEPVVA